jgi:hypothetical protein
MGDKVDQALPAFCRDCLLPLTGFRPDATTLLQTSINKHYSSIPFWITEPIQYQQITRSPDSGVA